MPALLVAAGLFERGHSIPVATWLVVLADVSLGLAGLSLGYLVYDVVVGKRPMMPVMRWVWPVTMGPFAILAYRKFQLDLAEGWREDAKPGARVPLSSVLGTDRIPVGLARKLETAVNRIAGSQELSDHERWKALEVLTARFLDAQE
ncbi:MAG: hypothetical protein ACRDZP_04625 [Acidimicrobiales bacterium]